MKDLRSKDPEMKDTHTHPRTQLVRVYIQNSDNSENLPQKEEIEQRTMQIRQASLTDTEALSATL